jgi:hypothetical protein
MKIITIFAHPKNKLYAFEYGEEGDVFQLAFNNWNDVEYLEDFFEKNKNDLQNGFYGNITVEEAVFKTLKEGEKLENQFRKIAKNEKNHLLNDVIFKPLSENEKLSLQKSKAYGLEAKSWLRIYAIRIDINTFIVTGATIKLTSKMQDRQHTKDELFNLSKAINYLQDNGIIDNEDIENIGYFEL